ncbi:MAG: Rpn family recombination-promoting nuclease/putative transposase [Treponema sp.]|jgi:predicted transposase/invertase (TIGR01784 family)|nr:Rpn family recombination-promoting nuclease/putative transposase [Treponema sp.]
MNNLFKRRRFSRELKRLAKEDGAQGKHLSVLNDIVFKAVLTSDSEDSREALRHLLSACTHREVSGVRVKNSEFLPAHLNAKLTRFDVHVTFNDGESADLEMQLCKPDDDLKARAVMYTTMLMAGQSRKGRYYREIKRVYQIFFLNFELFPNSEKLPRRYFYMEEEEHDRLTNATEIIFYEMPKLEQRVQDILAGKADMENLSGEEKWCTFMKYRHEDRAKKLIEELSLKEEGIMRAERAAAKIDRDYEKFARRLAEDKNRLDIALAREAIRRKGLKEGRAEERQYILDMINQGLSAEEIKRRLANEQ